MLISMFRRACVAVAFGLVTLSTAHAQSTAVEVGGLIFPDLTALTVAGGVLRLNETMRFNIPVQNPDGILVRVWIIPHIENHDRTCDVQYQGADALRLSGTYVRELYLLGGCDEVVLDGLDIFVLHEQTGVEYEKRVFFRERSR